VNRFTIEPEHPLSDDVRQLLEKHRRFAASVMPPEGVHVLDPDDLEDDVALFGVRDDGELLGIAALRRLDRHHAELKSMHTAAAARGRGVGRALVEYLLGVAAANGFRRVSLECGAGEAFAPARALYAAAGFEPCGPFGDYRATENNVFMMHVLAEAR
jgi:putative acetyltransferase